MQTGTTQARKPHPFGLLHRYGGIFSAVLVIFICITGLALNHTDDLELGKRHIGADWMLDLYGIETPPLTSFAYTDTTASQTGSSLYLGSKPVPGNFGELRGVISSAKLRIIATADTLILLSPAGELVEILAGFNGLPADINRIGLLSGHPVLDTENGYFQGDAQLLNWTPLTNNPAVQDTRWSVSTNLPVATAQQIASRYRGNGLTVERVILDLHSGRILGAFGPLLADLVAVIFILLAMTGIWMWFKTRRR